MPTTSSGSPPVRRRSSSRSTTASTRWRAGFNEIWDTWDLWEFQEHDIRDLGDSVLWLGRVHMRGGASQVELDQEAANLLDFSGDKIVRVRGFRSWQEALDAAGG